MYPLDVSCQCVISHSIKKCVFRQIGDTTTAHRHSIYVKSNTYVVWLLTSLELLKKLNMYLVYPKNMNMHIILLLFVNYLNEHVNVKRLY